MSSSPLESLDAPAWRRILRSRALKWVVGFGLVATLVIGTIAYLSQAANDRQAENPRSPSPKGAAALAALLTDQGVTVNRVHQVRDAERALDPGTTLVVANADRLTPAQGARLRSRHPGRIVLLRPGPTGLAAFAASAEPVAVPRSAIPTETPAGCSAEDATLAGGITMSITDALYSGTGTVSLDCYHVEGSAGGAEGSALVRVAAGETTVDVLGVSVANETLAQPGRAALLMNLLGSQPQLVWLMSPPAEPAEAVEGTEDRPEAAKQPTLLPGWWQPTLAMAGIALLVVGIWRGRRLGPIISEQLPVAIRASETVEGHGRLYYRIAARDRAAASLRSSAIRRLSRGYGHGTDPYALADAVASRTGRPAEQVRGLLVGPSPVDDDTLFQLARNLDQLEQEARQL